ncbi:50S ribosomal protein L16 [Candidatus Mycoplasma haematolamae str. Purdue]|uniref:Large ribosomal subunit protein uL16 n=1 Tax=Mycoplasma haematolamae (strain Purdue) TaxID=1212765 RepID=I7CFZ6_MYCHA|nr:50S ribosomal protein L16 [Candidatus Mycoplasma haematolamae]AFO52151.1 50S ribosomal protein L16 [Candidatus Mycoplasma haematolamae str. Purdue]
MMQPKRTKWRKPHKVSYEGKAKGNRYVAFGTAGLRALEGAWITERQLEAARVAISKRLGKTGKLWIRIFPHFSLTKKPLEVRMGSGKGAPDHFVATVKNGTIMFEVAGLDKETVLKTFYKAGAKLPIKTETVFREVTV